MSNKTNQPIAGNIGVMTAGSVVVANMIGTGVFTSLGFQAADITSVFALLMLWPIGGLIAFCGALAYGELGAASPRSGGEYHLLGEIYHPAIGFLAGWVSATVGFAAPTALAAVALAKYTAAVFPDLPTTHTAAAVVVAFALIHSYSVKVGSYFQNFFTLLKLLVVMFFVAAIAFVEQPVEFSLMPQASDWAWLASAPFAVSLVYVSYAYTGWNAAIYIAGELRNPQRDLPVSLFGSTLLVTMLYTAVNFVFLYTVPIADLAGKIEIGFLAGTYIFGSAIGDVLSLLIALLLLSTVSAMVFIGPRILKVMGEDYSFMSVLAKVSGRQTPVYATISQTVITLLFIYTASFEQAMMYTGFVLMMLTSLAVAGVYVLRLRHPNRPLPYKMWGYPVTPAVFLLANTWILGFVAYEKPWESLISTLIMVAGLAIYWLKMGK
ncbi:APC family permease [Rhodoflexus sp.]